MKKRLIILIVVGFLFITTGAVGGIINTNNGKVGVESTVDNSQYSNRSVKNDQYSTQYNRRTSNQKMGMARGSNYRNNQCPYTN